MAAATVEQILRDAAAFLGESEAEIFNPETLRPRFRLAYAALWNLMMRWDLQKPKRKTYALLPSHQNYLTPASAGVSDFGEPLEIYECGDFDTASITNITNAAPRVVTAAGHGVSTGSPLIVLGADLPELNRQWYGTRVSDAAFSLNGSTATGAASGGTVVTGGFDWTEMESKDWVDAKDPDSRLRFWQWTDDAFWFPGATEAKLLQIRYLNSGEAPESGDIGIDGSAPFLATLTAALTASAYGMPQRAAELKRDAFGPSSEPDGTGGMMRALCLPMLHEKQNRRKQAQPVRTRKVFV